jgi:hypothetical protein
MIKIKHESGKTLFVINDNGEEIEITRIEDILEQQEKEKQEETKKAQMLKSEKE